MAQFKNIVKWTLCICLIIGIVLAIVLPIASFATVDANQVGLDYDATTISIDQTTIYTSGRHFIGLADSFLLFPTQYMLVNFDGVSYPNISARTEDGIQITVAAAIQYSLKTDLASILYIYYHFEMDYQDAYVQIATNTARGTIAGYNAADIVSSSTTIQQALLKDISITLDTYGATVQNFQLLEVNFPDAFNNAIAQTQTEILNIGTLQNEVAKDLGNLQAELTQASTQAPSLVLQAVATATNLAAEAESFAASSAIRIQSLQTSMLTLQNSLNLNPRELITYQYVTSLQNLKTGINTNTGLSAPRLIKCLTQDASGCGI